MHLNRIDGMRRLHRTGLLALALTALVSAQAKPTLAVLPVQSTDATPEDAQAFHSEIERVFRSNPDVTLIDAPAAGLEEAGAAKGCLTASCSIEAGRVLDADKVVTPIVRKEGDNWVMTLRLVDARSGEVTVSKSGLSASPTAAGAASDFGAALTEPMVTALHVVEPVAPVVAAPAPSVPAAIVLPAAAAVSETAAVPATPAPAAAPVPVPAATASATDLPASPAPEAPSDSAKTGKTKKILLIAAGGTLIAGGIAAIVVLLTGKSSSSATASTSSGTGTTGSDTMNVTVKWN
jgi:TolB-like protein